MSWFAALCAPSGASPRRARARPRPRSRATSRASSSRARTPRRCPRPSAARSRRRRRAARWPGAIMIERAAPARARSRRPGAVSPRAVLEFDLRARGTRRILDLFAGRRRGLRRHCSFRRLAPGHLHASRGRLRALVFRGGGRGEHLSTGQPAVHNAAGLASASTGAGGGGLSTATGRTGETGSPLITSSSTTRAIIVW